jgi:hypothetical protein
VAASSNEKPPLAVGSPSGGEYPATTKPFAMIGLALVYEPAWAAELVSGGANGALCQMTAPVERFSAIA